MTVPSVGVQPVIDVQPIIGVQPVIAVDPDPPHDTPSPPDTTVRGTPAPSWEQKPNIKIKHLRENLVSDLQTLTASQNDSTLIPVITSSIRLSFRDAPKTFLDTFSVFYAQYLPQHWQNSLRTYLGKRYSLEQALSHIESTFIVETDFISEFAEQTFRLYFHYLPWKVYKTHLKDLPVHLQQFGQYTWLDIYFILSYLTPVSIWNQALPVTSPYNQFAQRLDQVPYNLLKPTIEDLARLGQDWVTLIDNLDYFNMSAYYPQVALTHQEPLDFIYPSRLNKITSLQTISTNQIHVVQSAYVPGYYKHNEQLTYGVDLFGPIALPPPFISTYQTNHVQSSNYAHLAAVPVVQPAITQDPTLTQVLDTLAALNTRIDDLTLTSVKKSNSGSGSSGNQPRSRMCYFCEDPKHAIPQCPDALAAISAGLAKFVVLNGVRWLADPDGAVYKYRSASGGIRKSPHFLEVQAKHAQQSVPPAPSLNVIQTAIFSQVSTIQPSFNVHSQSNRAQIANALANYAALEPVQRYYNYY